jgi:hypothetical protein
MDFLTPLGQIAGFGFDEVPRWIAGRSRVRGGDEDGAQPGPLPY